MYATAAAACCCAAAFCFFFLCEEDGEQEETVEEEEEKEEVEGKIKTGGKYKQKTKNKKIRETGKVVMVLSVSRFCQIRPGLSFAAFRPTGLA